MKTNSNASIERRKARRRPLLDSFSFFISIVGKGSYRLEAHDISELGMGFDFDIEGENRALTQVQVGDILELKLYLNQNLSIPLVLRVARVQVNSLIRKIGAEFQDRTSSEYKAFLALLQMIDHLHGLSTSETE